MVRIPCCGTTRSCASLTYCTYLGGTPVCTTGLAVVQYLAFGYSDGRSSGTNCTCCAFECLFSTKCVLFANHWRSSFCVKAFNDSADGCESLVCREGKTMVLLTRFQGALILPCLMRSHAACSPVSQLRAASSSKRSRVVLHCQWSADSASTSVALAPLPGVRRLRSRCRGGRTF